MSRLVADIITCRFGSLSILSDIYLQTEGGEVVGLVGRNGCGKTTLLRCVSGLVGSNTGIVKVDGRFTPRFQRW